MPLDAETILEIKKAVKEALAEEHDEFYVPRKDHFLDHQMIARCRQTGPEWEKNHQFISDVRDNFSTAKRAGLWSVSISLITFIIGALIWAITQGYSPR